MMNVALAALEWKSLDTQIVLVGVLGAMACALLGNFLVLRKMSMMGDAISHAVLPGLAIAFLLSGTRDALPMFVGAAIAGVLTAAFTHWIHSFGKVDQGASMGVVFTCLFAVGLILIVRAADHVDLDPGCVLYGAIEYVPLDQRSLFGLMVPRAALVVGSVLIVNALVVLLLFKELRICSFDPALARTQGINATLMHYLLMILVAITTVAAFESVGSILVIAMLIVPPAAAHLLTDRLHVMILLSLVIAALGAALGHLSAITVPTWFGYADTNTAGMMAVVTGLLFAVVMFAAPRHGVISKVVHRQAVGLRIAREDALGLLYRLEEADVPDRGPLLCNLLRTARSIGPISRRLALAGLERAGSITRTGRDYQLTERGRATASGLVRSHRLWESYLEKHMGMPQEELHFAAEQLEHVTDAQMQEGLAQTTARPDTDPHGKPIPPA